MVSPASSVKLKPRDGLGHTVTKGRVLMRLGE
ncbi:uncharacterized protein G2W53_020793 [Senna tora]|uniref:Uncharacterized protein n=1 Tax=Senna tora TaxID=362788 RepID=A0A834WMV2_9FABA|nr:uncharacterized protein G2W53_020793 [Senna tora]